MALLREKFTLGDVRLRAMHVFGRHQSKADTIIDSPQVSQIHAAIRWDGCAWLLHDYSRNGTYINGKPIAAHGCHVLATGNAIRFSSEIHPSWIVVDLAPPYLTIEPCDTTMPLTALAADKAKPAEFDFFVSQNEEHVELRIRTGHELVDLGERSHHYGLLTLARRRLQDARRGFDRYSQGWLATDELARMLHLDPKHLNMQMHRARQQIGDAVANAHCPLKVIERRRGELRFGSVMFQITRGAELEGRFDPAAYS